MLSRTIPPGLLPPPPRHPEGLRPHSQNGADGVSDPSCLQSCHHPADLTAFILNTYKKTGGRGRIMLTSPRPAPWPNRCSYALLDLCIMSPVTPIRPFPTAILRSACLCLLTCLLLSFASSAQQQRPVIRLVGHPDAAPDFLLSGLDGKPV